MCLLQCIYLIMFGIPVCYHSSMLHKNIFENYSIFSDDSTREIYSTWQANFLHFHPEKKLFSFSCSNAFAYICLWKRNAYDREFFCASAVFFFSFISIFVWICGLKFINRFSLSHDSNNCKTTATTKWTNFHVKHLSLLLLISLIVRIFYVITKVKKENKNQRKKWQKVNTKKRNSMTLCMVRGKRRWIWSME